VVAREISEGPRALLLSDGIGFVRHIFGGRWYVTRPPLMRCRSGIYWSQRAQGTRPTTSWRDRGDPSEEYCGGDDPESLDVEVATRRVLVGVGRIIQDR